MRYRADVTVSFTVDGVDGSECFDRFSRAVDALIKSDLVGVKIDPHDIQMRLEQVYVAGQEFWDLIKADPEFMRRFEQMKRELFPELEGLST